MDKNNKPYTIKEAANGGETTADDWFVVWRDGVSDEDVNYYKHFKVKLPFERIFFMLEKQGEKIESLTKQIHELTQQVQLIKELK